MTKSYISGIGLVMVALAANLSMSTLVSAHHLATPEEQCRHLYNPALPAGEQSARYLDCIRVKERGIELENQGYTANINWPETSVAATPTPTPTPTPTATPQSEQGTGESQTVSTPTPKQNVQSTPTPQPSATVEPTAQPEATASPRQSLTSVVKKVFQSAQRNEEPTEATDQETSEPQSTADENASQESEDNASQGFPYIAGLGVVGLVASLALYRHKQQK